MPWRGTWRACCGRAHEAPDRSHRDGGVSAEGAVPRLGALGRVVAGLVLGLALAFAVSLLVHRGAPGAGGTPAATATTTFPVGDLGPAPDLAGFTDQRGAPFDPSSLAGKVQVVSFLDPRGTRVSPVIAVNTLMALKADLQGTKQFGTDVVFVSIDVNPRPDGPEPTAAFLKQVVGFGNVPATPADWAFLSAPWATVAHVVRHGYGVPFQRLDAKAFAAYAAREKANGTYFYARAWNPLASKGPPTIVDNGEIVIVGPKGRIRARIPRAYQVSAVAVENAVSQVLARSGD